MWRVVLQGWQHIYRWKFSFLKGLCNNKHFGFFCCCYDKKQRQLREEDVYLWASSSYVMLFTVIMVGSHCVSRQEAEAIGCLAVVSSLSPLDTVQGPPPNSRSCPSLREIFPYQLPKPQRIQRSTLLVTADSGSLHQHYHSELTCVG